MAAKKTSKVSAAKKAPALRKTSKKASAQRNVSKEIPSAKKAPAQRKVNQGAAEKKVRAGAQVVGIQPGRRAPRFELSDQAGNLIRSSDLAGKPYVLYFYPKDNTPGCTQEACDFRDHFAAFRRSKVRVFGVSPDSAKSHAGFVEKHSLPFPLLVDAEKELATAFGVWAKKQNYGREYFGIVRSTFLIGADGIVRKAWRGVRVPGHVEAVLAAAKEKE